MKDFNDELKNTHGIRTSTYFFDTKGNISLQMQITVH